jgi:acyl-CoA thioester hydrolase
MPALHETTIEVRWSDVDQNRHVRHSAYYDYGAHMRIRFFDRIGFNTEKLAEVGIGPILFKEECTFLKELHATDTVRINMLNGGARTDGSRWTLHHELFNQDGVKCAHLTVQGAWMDLKARKLTVPPSEIAESIAHLPAGEAFVYRKTSGS